MVVFVDLDNDPEPLELSSGRPEVLGHWSHTSVYNRTKSEIISPERLYERENPNKNAVTEALGCYL